MAYSEGQGLRKLVNESISYEERGCISFVSGLTDIDRLGAVLRQKKVYFL